MCSDAYHRFRNADKLQVLGYREYIREHLPSGPDGCVIEDLDLVVRQYGKRWHLDDEGHLMLAELKYGDAWIGRAQERTFGLIDKLLRLADPMGKRYKGYYVVNYTDEDWTKAEFKINRVPVTRSQLNAFLQFDFDSLPHIPSAFR